MNGNKKRIAALCLLLVVGGGWAGLASRYTGSAARAQAVPGAGSLLSDPNAAAPVGTSLDGNGVILRMLLAVGIVIGLGAAALYMSKKVLPRIAHPAGREIRIIETTCLGPRKALHLVEVGGQRLLIASSSDRITMLTPVGDAWLDAPKEQADSAVEL
jgi:flagellar biogenesis protein FliO